MSMFHVGFNTISKTTSLTNILLLKGCQRSSLGLSQGFPIFQFTHIQLRNYSFVSKVTSEQLWEGVTTVSPAGRRRGRMKSTKRRINLDIGQKIGYGKKGLVLPGLNTWVLRKDLLKVNSTDVDERKNFEINLQNIRDKREQYRKNKVPRYVNKIFNPLLRGYTSYQLGGKSFGPPAPVRDETFEGFDSKVLESRKVNKVLATQGQVFSYRSLVAVGNGNGLAGFAVAKAKTPGRAAIKARDKAGQRLMFIERFNGHTIYHNTYAQFHATKIFCKRQFDGHGVVADRVLKDLCHLAGIKDLYVKIEGNSRNKIALTTAFFNAMTHQETHQDLANRVNMHVVEVSNQRGKIPIVLASPENGQVQDKYYGYERDVYDVDTLYTKGKPHWYRPRIRPVWERMGLASYKRRMAREFRRRGQHEAQKVRRLCGLEPSKEERLQRDISKRKKE